MEVYTWQEMEWETVTPGIARRIITGVHVMSAQVKLEKGAVVPMHAHHHEQISFVMQGTLQFQAGGRQIILTGGQVLVIPPHEPHMVVALEESLVLDNFSPIRQDWLDHTDTYLREARPTK